MSFSIYLPASLSLVYMSVVYHFPLHLSPAHRFFNSDFFFLILVIIFFVGCLSFVNRSLVCFPVSLSFLDVFCGFIFSRLVFVSLVYLPD